MFQFLIILFFALSSFSGPKHSQPQNEIVEIKTARKIRIVKGDVALEKEKSKTKTTIEAKK